MQVHGHGQQRHQRLARRSEEVDRLHEGLPQFWRGESKLQLGQCELSQAGATKGLREGLKKLRWWG